jgi:hypothetical protein
MRADLDEGCISAVPPYAAPIAQNAIACPTGGSVNPLRAGPALHKDQFGAIRRSMVLEGCKWDPQVGDISTLAPFPLILRADAWRNLVAWAEQLTAQTLAAEQEILSTPKLLDQLGLPRAMRRLLRDAARCAPTQPASRVMRFDFHYTRDGWRVSEVNSDVPGGFTEASIFTRLMAEHFPALRMAGNPLENWSRCIAANCHKNGTVALLSAPGFMEDHQIIACLGRQLNSHGLRAHLAGPRQIAWRDGQAWLASAWHQGPLNAIVRFYQAEWLPSLPRSCGWPHFVLGGRTPVGNPGVAVLSESKRFPLVWDALRAPLPAWRWLLPETRDPRDADWQTDDGWLLKSAFCNNGDTVSIRTRLDANKWRAVVRNVRHRPGDWIAQRRFDAIPIATPLGEMHPCIGVYTFNGKRGGAYARITSRPLIDYAAMDIALLLAND